MSSADSRKMAGETDVHHAPRQMPYASLTPYTPAAEYPLRAKPRDPKRWTKLEAETRAIWVPRLEAARRQETNAALVVRAQILGRPGRPLCLLRRAPRPCRPTRRRQTASRRRTARSRRPADPSHLAVPSPRGLP